jgi:hypothetical protein
MGPKAPGVDDAVMGISITGRDLPGKADSCLCAGSESLFVSIDKEKHKKPAQEAFFSDYWH